MKLLCFGNSNTYGYDPRSCFGGRYPACHRWVDILAGKMGSSIFNGGENGREIPVREADLHRFESLMEQQRPVDLLIVMLGGNDLLQGCSVDETVGRMRTFLQHIDLEAEKIMLIGPPPMQRGQWVPHRALIDASWELNRRYRALAEELGTAFSDAGEWDVPLSFDGVHFTEEGHKTFAQGLFDRLRNEL